MRRVQAEAFPSLGEEDQLVGQERTAELICSMEAAANCQAFTTVLQLHLVALCDSLPPSCLRNWNFCGWVAATCIITT